MLPHLVMLCLGTRVSTTLMDLACLVKVSTDFPSKIRCFQKEHSITLNISDMLISEIILIIIIVLRVTIYTSSSLKTIFLETSGIRFGFLGWRNTNL